MWGPMLAGIILIAGGTLALVTDPRTPTIPEATRTERTEPEWLGRMVRMAKATGYDEALPTFPATLSSKDQKRFREHLKNVANTRGWLLPPRTNWVVLPAQDANLLHEMAKHPVSFINTQATTLSPQAEEPKELLVMELEHNRDMRGKAALLMLIIGLVTTAGGTIVTALAENG